MRDEVPATPAEREQRVTSLELFFDLIFVLALTQVGTFLHGDPSWLRLLEAAAILMALWIGWSDYVWLGNRAATDEGLIRVVLLTAMCALLVISLAVPHAFGDDALVFGIAYFFVLALHIVAYAAFARGDPALRAAVGRLALTSLPAAALLVLAGVLPGTGRAICWVVALTLSFGVRIAGLEGWGVVPSHIAERFGLIIILALGESIIALGVGAADLPITAGLIVGALLGVAVAGALWWAYFDSAAMAVARKLRDAAPAEQVRIAVDAYSYAHLPMVAGILFFAFGVETTLAHRHAHLSGLAATTLSGGVALYLLALNVFMWLGGRWISTPRLVAAAILVALVPVATVLPALLSLGLVALVACGLIAYENVRYAAIRARIRHEVG